MAQTARKKLIKNLSWSVTLPPIRNLYALALMVILSKNLSVADYGDWSLFIANIGLVITFSSLNLMYASAVRLTGKPPEEQSVDIFRIGLFKLVVTLVVFVGFGFYLYYQQIFEVRIIWLMMAALLFRALNDMTFGFLRALLKLKQQVGILLFESVMIIIGVGTGGVLLGYGLIGAIVGFVLAESVTTAVGLYQLKGHLSIAKWDWGTVGEYLKIGLPLIPFSFSDLIVNALVPLIIRTQSGSEMVALYSMAQKVAMVSTLPNAIVNNIYAQYLKQAALDHGGAGVRRKLFQFLSLYGALVIPLIGILYFFGERIILLVSTEAYIGTHKLMILLALVNVIIMLTALFTTVYAVFDRTGLVGGMWIAILALFGLAAWYAVPPYGLIGMAWALIGSFGLGLVLVALGGIRLTFKRLKIPQNL